MAFDTFTALVLFAAVASVTPGPNNMMVLASGVNFGYRRTIPHICGIAGGFFTLLVCVGAGLGALLTAYPAAHTALKVAGGIYLLYLAWRIATAGAIGGTDSRPEPMSFMAAAMFQWVNPKAWMMGISAMALYTDTSQPFISVLLIATIFGLITFPSVSVWTGFGTALRGILADDRRRRVFNVAMGVLLALCIVPMVR